MSAVKPKATKKKVQGEVSNRRKVQPAPKAISATAVGGVAVEDDEDDGEGLFLGTTALIARPMVLDAATKAAAQQKIQAGRAEKKLKKGKSAAQADPVAEVGVIYLGHIPFGFFERQMKEFFSQFGTVTRLRVSRSKITARSRGYAFIEFANKQVAAVVAETMNNYVMYNRVLECHVVTPDKVHADTFKNAGTRFRRVPRRQLAQAKHNVSRTEEQFGATVAKLVSKETRKRKRLQDEGIDYDFPGYTAAVPALAARSAPPPAPTSTKKGKASVTAVVQAAATTTTDSAPPPAPTSTKKGKASVTAVVQAAATASSSSPKAATAAKTTRGGAATRTVLSAVPVASKLGKAAADSALPAAKKRKLNTK